MYAQDANTLFKEFSKERNADYVSVSPFLMSLGKRFAPKDVKSEWVGHVRSVRVMDLESCSPDTKKRFRRKALALSLNGYEELLHTKRDGETVSILAKLREDSIEELLLVCHGADDCALIQLRGRLTKEDIDKLAAMHGKEGDGRHEL
jgi:hypothetical protein